MKNAIITALVLAVGCLTIVKADRPQALIQDVSNPSADSAPAAGPTDDQAAPDPDEEIV